MGEVVEAAGCDGRAEGASFGSRRRSDLLMMTPGVVRGGPSWTTGVTKASGGSGAVRGGVVAARSAAQRTGVVPDGERVRSVGVRSVLATVVTTGAVGVGIADRPALVVGFLICAAVFIPLEQLLPLVPRAGWRRSAWVDIAHTFGNRLPITIGTGALLGAVAPVLQAVFPDQLRQQILTQPVWVQFILVLLVVDLASYTAHRALHEVPVLWRLHAVHHSSPELDWLSTSRGHPIDQILNMTVATLPLAAVGFSFSFWTGFLAFTFFYPFLAHANTTITLRWLSPIFVTPAFHHWHHADEADAVNTNYGTVFSFWDRLFGSWHLPDRMPTAYGIDQPMPQTWLGQLASPLVSWPSRRPTAVTT